MRKLWEITVEYADTVIALVLAIVFGVLGAVGQVTTVGVLSGLILTTLAVLAVVILRDRISMSESRRIIANLPSRLRRIDELSQGMAELQKLVEGNAMVRALRGSDIQMAHTEARKKTEHWYFKGGTGTYLRAKTLPSCVEAARSSRRAIMFRIEIIDPTNERACERYESFRRSVSSEPDGTGDTWYQGRARLESFATVVAACWNRQQYQPLDIRLGLTDVVSTFRYDMSSEYLIVTTEDSDLPGLLVPRGKPLFDAYGVELHNSFEQARIVPLERTDRMPLSDDPTTDEVRKLLEALDLRPERPLDEKEAAIVVQKAFHAKNPYG